MSSYTDFFFASGFLNQKKNPLLHFYLASKYDNVVPKGFESLERGIVTDRVLQDKVSSDEVSSV